MNDNKRTALNDLSMFLAHALALESEATERLEELSAVMQAHNNTDTANLFSRLAHYGRIHAQEVEQMMEDLPRVKLAPWEYEWGSDEAPETSAMENAHYLMTTAHAMQMALKTEQSAHDYYASVAARAENDDVRRYAQEFTKEEAEHVGYVKSWIAGHPVELVPIPEDDDPPHMPE